MPWVEPRTLCIVNPCFLSKESTIPTVWFHTETFQFASCNFPKFLKETWLQWALIQDFYWHLIRTSCFIFKHTQTLLVYYLIWRSITILTSLNSTFKPYSRQTVCPFISGMRYYLSSHRSCALKWCQSGNFLLTMEFFFSSLLKKLYKTLSEVKLEVETVIKTGRHIVQKQQTDNPKSMDEQLTSLKVLYNDLGAQVGALLSLSSLYLSVTPSPNIYQI